MHDAHAYCADLVRRHDKDRYLAGLFAPQPARSRLFALYAFNIEIARVRELVSDPLPGEVRLQWWREVVRGEGRGEVAGHPVAAALVEAIKARALPFAPFDELIEARIFDLYDEPMPTLADLEDYAAHTAANLVSLASVALGCAPQPALQQVARHAGIAYGLTGLLRAFPLHAARGQVYLPLDLLAAKGADPAEVLRGEETPGIRTALAEVRAIARRHLAETRLLCRAIPAEAAPAFLPASLVDLHLDRMERPDYHPFADTGDVPQWRRQWRLWRQARRVGRTA